MMSPGMDIEARLRAAGLRPTRRRRVLLRIIAESQHPLDIEAILGRARRHEPRISRATIYRFLATLRRLGAMQPTATLQVRGRITAFRPPSAEASRSSVHP